MLVGMGQGIRRQAMGVGGYLGRVKGFSNERTQDDQFQVNHRRTPCGQLRLPKLRTLELRYERLLVIMDQFRAFIVCGLKKEI